MHKLRKHLKSMRDFKQKSMKEKGIRVKKHLAQDDPGGTVAKTPHSQSRGPAIQSLVRELESTGPNQRSHMPQLRLDTGK